ncbi:hypothetical protein [Streptomyces sp. NPDC059575]|uniref:hypothetical protein n=1 Tax=Streptomyces sp. NPDC059575 TaxID=3346872 RepID=UPI0036C26448
MRRFVLPIAALLLTAACGSGDTGDTGEAKAVPASSPTAERTASPVPAQKPKSAEPEKTCGTTRDIDVWMKVPELPDSAQVLGGYSLATCQTTFEYLKSTSPTQTGYCTEAAWASDNPGYDAEATPAKRLKHVQVAIGPAC